MTRFLDAVRKSLGIDLVFVWAVDSDLISVGEIELGVISSGIGIDVFCVLGSKKTLF